MLDAFDLENVVRHQDQDSRFVDVSEDTLIVATVAKDDPPPIFMTCDVNMYTRNPVERKALKESGLTCVFIKKNFNNLSFHQQAMKLLSLWPAIVRETSLCRFPTAFEITPAATKLQYCCLTHEL